jgi:glycolate oxidase FAD binding subunit
VSTLAADSIGAVQEALGTHARLLSRGGGTKPALSSPTDGATMLDLSGLSGVTEYDPGEFTFTALAGTKLADIAAMLAENGQYLPFDPPFVKAGATLGGTLAAGLSGPGRTRFGGVRDFILGVRFVDGAGRLVRGGGKVVKNAAGFDLPKLMVGSMGRLGVLIELSFKVFPAPKAYATLQVSCDSLADALQALVRLSRAPFDLEALELEPPERLCVRIGGLPEALPSRIKRLEAFLERTGETLTGEAEASFWEALREFRWVPEGASLVKVPLTPKRLLPLEEQLERAGAERRYSVAGNLAWLAWSHEVSELDALLSGLELSGLVLKGPSERLRLGKITGDGLLKRVKATLDPKGRFPAY